MNKKGSIIFCLLLITVLTGLAAAILMRSVNESKIAQRNANSTQALWLADAGVHKAHYEYVSNNCTGMVQYGTSTACANCTCAGAVKLVSATVTGSGDYDVVLNSSNTLITSIGYVPSRTDANKIRRTVQVGIGGLPLFSYAAYAEGQIEIAPNAVIDSYNSTTAAYGGSNVSTNGDIGTNGTGNGVIHLDNNAIVSGDVSTGAGGTVTVDNGASVSGATTSTNNRTLTSVIVPSSLTSLASEGAYTVGNNDSATISGDHQYSSISLSNGSTLNISGNVSLYLSSATTSFNTGNNITLNIPSGSSLTIYGNGAITFDNNAVINNASSNPAKFLIYSTSTQAVTIENNGDFFGAIYAPDATVEISNNAGFYGAVVGSEIEQANNGGIHYDENLLNLVNPFGGSSLINWQET